MLMFYSHRPGSSKWTLILHVSHDKSVCIFLVRRVGHMPANSNHTVAVTLYFERPSNRTFFINQLNTTLFHLRDVIFISMENFCLKVVSDIWQFIEGDKGRVR